MWECSLDLCRYIACVITKLGLDSPTEHTFVDEDNDELRGWHIMELGRQQREYDKRGCDDESKRDNDPDHKQLLSLLVRAAVVRSIRLGGSTFELGC